MSIETMNEQPEALRLAELIDRGNYNHYDVIEAAAELRRLHAVNQELLEALKLAEAGLADIGDADREPGDDLAWCERRAAAANHPRRHRQSYWRESMNSDDIIKMAQEAGWEMGEDLSDVFGVRLARFSSLTYAAGAAAERKRIVNSLMIHHEMAQGRHNYYKHVALLIEADKGVTNDT